MIYVIASVELVNGKRHEYLTEFNKVAPSVRSENGCIEYGVTADVATSIPVQEPINENIVTIMEKWTNIDALKVHLTTPHMKTYREAVKDYVKQVKIRVLNPL
jgi:quinol monooxygenase YgiN